jgi:hypothetical protein
MDDGGYNRLYGNWLYIIEEDFYEVEVGCDVGLKLTGVSFYD